MKFKLNKNLFKVIYEGIEGYVITDKTLVGIKDWFYYEHFGEDIICQANSNIDLINLSNTADYFYKIIASTFTLGDLPQFIVEEDFNTLNDDINILRNFDYPSLIYEKDLSIKESNAYKNGLVTGYKKGWNKHAEKYKFTEEDVKKAIQLAREADSIDGVVDLPIVLNYPNADNSDLQIKWMEEEIIQFLQQPKEIIEIEFETEEYAVGNYGLSDGEPTIDTRLKITKSIKYPNGLLTIKNMKYEINN